MVLSYWSKKYRYQCKCCIISIRTPRSSSPITNFFDLRGITVFITSHFYLHGQRTKSHREPLCKHLLRPDSRIAQMTAKFSNSKSSAYGSSIRAGKGLNSNFRTDPILF